MVAITEMPEEAPSRSKPAPAAPAAPAADARAGATASAGAARSAAAPAAASPRPPAPADNRDPVLDGLDRTGRAAYTRQDYEAALRAFSEGLAREPKTNTALVAKWLSNRSAAYLQLARPALALVDAATCLRSGGGDKGVKRLAAAARALARLGGGSAGAGAGAPLGAPLGAAAASAPGGALAAPAWGYNGAEALARVEEALTLPTLLAGPRAQLEALRAELLELKSRAEGRPPEGAAPGAAVAAGGAAAGAGAVPGAATAAGAAKVGADKPAAEAKLDSTAAEKPLAGAKAAAGAAAAAAPAVAAGALSPQPAIGAAEAAALRSGLAAAIARAEAAEAVAAVAVAEAAGLRQALAAARGEANRLEREVKRLEALAASEAQEEAELAALMEADLIKRAGAAASTAEGAERDAAPAANAAPAAGAARPHGAAEPAPAAEAPAVPEPVVVPAAEAADSKSTAATAPCDPTAPSAAVSIPRPRGQPAAAAEADSSTARAGDSEAAAGAGELRHVGPPSRPGTPDQSPDPAALSKHQLKKRAAAAKKKAEAAAPAGAAAEVRPEAAAAASAPAAGGPKNDNAAVAAAPAARKPAVAAAGVKALWADLVDDSAAELAGVDSAVGAGAALAAPPGAEQPALAAEKQSASDAPAKKKKRAAAAVASPTKGGAAGDAAPVAPAAPGTAAAAPAAEWPASEPVPRALIPAACAGVDAAGAPPVPTVLFAELAAYSAAFAPGGAAAAAGTGRPPAAAMAAAERFAAALLGDGLCVVRLPVGTGATYRTLYASAGRFFAQTAGAKERSTCTGRLHGYRRKGPGEFHEKFDVAGYVDPDFPWPADPATMRATCTSAYSVSHMIAVTCLDAIAGAGLRAERPRALRALLDGAGGAPVTAKNLSETALRINCYSGVVGAAPGGPGLAATASLPASPGGAAAPQAASASAGPPAAASCSAAQLEAIQAALGAHTDNCLLTVAPAGTRPALEVRRARRAGAGRGAGPGAASGAPASASAGKTLLGPLDHDADGPVAPWESVEGDLGPDDVLVFAGDQLGRVTLGAVPALMHRPSVARTLEPLPRRAAVPSPAGASGDASGAGANSRAAGPAAIKAAAAAAAPPPPRLSAPFFLRARYDALLGPAALGPAAAAALGPLPAGRLGAPTPVSALDTPGERAGWPWKQAAYYRDSAYVGY